MVSDLLNDTSGLLTIRDWLRWTYSRFNEDPSLFYGHGTDNSWDETLHLVLQALNLPWDYDSAYFDSRLTDSERQQLTALVQRRIREHIPTAYLLNQAWFYGMPFYVDERVLVPRSPIAELIEKGFEPWLGGQTVDRVLDLCCGSGCIGIACSQAFPEAQVDLVDISEDALEVAHINIDRFELWDRVRTVQSDMFLSLKTMEDRPRYQLIVSNPPYVDAEDMADLPDEYLHEPALGLEAGNDGLDFARTILTNAAEFLDENGLLVVEVGNSEWALQEAYPEVPFTWVEFEHGGHGVFVLTAEECRRYRDRFGDSH
ncbi:50S ribosomal protein L3 N(5)-glutamine methyltransferase [Kistimonas asteriae]|uniref:50S ribosomal protein L3 N(5)-glutamine methyltransferase n=1 Tax=Kistimonas asteriae TaxID=517724 RepID=UPI001BA4A6D4